LNGFDIAVIIPCYNEARTIGQVVQDFHRHLPSATVYVFDNDSNDSTAAVAQAAGATVIWEGRRGKGNVVRRMFAEVLADAYVMIDGDGTYDAGAAPEMVELLFAGRLDMVVATRLESRSRFPIASLLVIGCCSNCRCPAMSRGRSEYSSPAGGFSG
jgi:glycosyltransferase involved in cell wall biosynthesis